MEFNIVNEQKRDKRTINIGFDWPAFFSPWIFGIPHFLRGQIKLAVLLIAIGLIATVVVYLPGLPEDERVLMSLMFTIFFIGLSIYLGKVGRKLYTKHLLENGYTFEDENSDIVSQCKSKWDIL